MKKKQLLFFGTNIPANFHYLKGNLKQLSVMHLFKQKLKKLTSLVQSYVQGRSILCSFITVDERVVARQLSRHAPKEQQDVSVVPWTKVLTAFFSLRLFQQVLCNPGGFTELIFTGSFKINYQHGHWIVRRVPLYLWVSLITVLVFLCFCLHLMPGMLHQGVPQGSVLTPLLLLFF